MAYTVKMLGEFSDWLRGLKDGLTRQRLSKRLRKATQQADIRRAIALAKSLED